MDEAAGRADLPHPGQEARDEGRIVLAVSVQRDEQRGSGALAALLIAADLPQDVAWRSCRSQG